MKKYFEAPVIEIEDVAVEDVITTSNCDSYNPSCPLDAGEF